MTNKWTTKKGRVKVLHRLALLGTLLVYGGLLIPGRVYAGLGQDLSFPYYSEASAACSGSSILVGSDNAEKVWNFFISKGLEPFQAAGIMGNLQAESHFDPSIEERGGTGIGIAQWSFGRHDALVAAAQAQGVDIHQDNDANLSFQLDYLYNESMGRDSRSFPGTPEWEGIKRTVNETSTDHAVGSTTYWEYNFERPLVAGQPIRIQFATALLALYGSGTGAGSPSGGSSGGCGDNADNGSLPSGTPQELAQQILDSGKVSGDSRYIAQIQSYASGNTSCNINPVILGMILAMSERFTIHISSLNRLCTGVIVGAGRNSRHYIEGGGHAVDLDRVDGVEVTGGTAKDLEVINYLLPKLPPGSRIGQSQCRTTPIQLPSGITEFAGDPCTHLHMDAEPQ